MKWKKQGILFGIGGVSYVFLELLWRGRSHISMLFAGGLCFLLLGKLKNRPISRAGKACFGSAIITGVELATGLLVNRDYSVWDYRGMPLSFLGQICLPFSVLWMPLSLLAMWLYRQIEGFIELRG